MPDESDNNIGKLQLLPSVKARKEAEKAAKEKEEKELAELQARRNLTPISEELIVNMTKGFTKDVNRAHKDDKEAGKQIKEFQQTHIKQPLPPIKKPARDDVSVKSTTSTVSLSSNFSQISNVSNVSKASTLTGQALRNEKNKEAVASYLNNSQVTSPTIPTTTKSSNSFNRGGRTVV